MAHVPNQIEKLEPPTEKLESTAINDPLMEYMTQYAVTEVEKRLASELVNKAVEEHLLLEFAFESVLKSLLRDPSPPHTQATRTPLLSTIPSVKELTSPGHSVLDSTMNISKHTKTAPKKTQNTQNQLVIKPKNNLTLTNTVSPGLNSNKEDDFAQ